MKKNLLLRSIVFFLLIVLFDGCIREQINYQKNTQSDEKELQEQKIKNYNKNIEIESETKSLILEEKKYALSKRNELRLQSNLFNRRKINYDHIYKVKIPVLMYHSIASQGTDPLVIHPEEFAKQMKWLNDHEFTPLFLDELYDMLNTGKDVPIRPIALTFDDGYEDNYLNAFPELKTHKFKATIFIITNKIDQPNYLSTDEMIEMSENNIDFQSHTANHIELTQLNYEGQIREMEKSKATLKNILQKDICALCYPVGKFNENTIKAAKYVGFKMCFTTRFGYAKRKDGFYKLSRVRMFPGFNMEALN